MTPDETAPKILLVDDSRVVLDIGKRKLRDAGYRVVVHPRGFGAVDVALAERPDVVMVDVTAPMLQGAWLCQTLKSHPRTRGITILLHSPLDDAELSLRAVECGADGYLSKYQEWEQRISMLGHRVSASMLPAAG